MVEIVIDKIQYKVKKDITIIEACKEVGVEIPRFCYHEKLSIAGNCRMCLVEVEKSMKPVASCAMPVMNKMEIKTNSKLVKKAREGVMEMLLANHPLDCPICDQGGECDLQDQSLVFGSDRGRYYEEKRSVMDKNCGPLVKTIMTRCIHCTRCVRYLREVAGVGTFGTTGRGNSMEIGTYVMKGLTTEVSGNIIDLCPVGALTSKPYAYVGRSWELKNINSIDVYDSMGSRMSVCVRGNDVLRVLPIINEEINENWLTDKARFGYDGYRMRRIVNPMVREGGKLKEVSWEEAFSKFIRKVTGSKGISAIVGNGLDMESSVMVKELMNRLGSNDYRNVESGKEVDIRGGYISKRKYKEIGKGGFVLIVGINVRLEVPLLGIRLRREEKNRGLVIGSIGTSQNQNMKVLDLGSSSKVIEQIVSGKSWFCTVMMKSGKGDILVSKYIAKDKEMSGYIGGLEKMSKYMDIGGGVSYIGYGSNSVGQSNIGISRKKKGEGEVLYIVNEDNIEIKKEKYKYVVYQGTHGDRVAEEADLILPSTTVLEKEGIYVNGEGRGQLANYVISGPGNSRNDWQILRGLIEYVIGEKESERYDTIKGIRNRIMEIAPMKINEVNKDTVGREVEKRKEEGRREKQKIVGGMYSNYYMTNNVSRASKVMAISEKKNKEKRVNYRWN